jgi:L-alanine-DL-glutamate epimerase-like enolase superfamily enzyme
VKTPAAKPPDDLFAGFDRLRSVEVVDVALPVRREWRWRGLNESLGRWSIVRVETEAGIVGHGEATALRDWGGDHNRYFGETPQTVRHVVEDIVGPLLLGSDPFDVESAMRLMDGAVRGHTYAKAALEMALYDIQGKLVGLPVYKLLGGKAREGVPIAHMIGIMGTDEAVHEAVAAAEDGISAFQIKGTGDLARDAEVVAAVRKAVGDSFTLRLDANQGYAGRSVKDAIHAVFTLQEAGADLVEQPTEGLRQMAQVTSAVHISIIADESCWQPEDVIDVAEQGAADVISIYLAKAGGISRAKRVATIAEAFGLPCDVNGSLESGIGNAANVHFAVSSPSVTLACVIPVSAPKGANSTQAAGRYYLDDLVADEFRFAGGILYPPEAPGLVTVDEEKLNAYRIG